jgi:hypothetical protein
MESLFIGICLGAFPAFFFGIETGKLIRKWETEVVTAVKDAKIETLQSFVGTIKTKRELHND